MSEPSAAPALSSTSYETLEQCRVCRHNQLTTLFSLGEQYVSDFPKRITAAAKGVFKVPIEVVQCRRCGLSQQRYTAPAEALYRKNYWYRSGVTETMRAALRDVAAAAEREARLSPGDVVLDLGSNDGTLLRSYRMPRLFTVGVEPAENFKVSGADGLAAFVSEFWGTDEGLKVYYQKAKKQAKVITACGMLYDLEDPNAFVAQAAEVLAPDGVFIAQLMCAKQMLDSGDVGNLAHEHLEFYTLASLDYLFKRHGLHIYDVEENAVNGGSYRLYARHLSVNTKAYRSGKDLASIRRGAAYLAEQEAGLDRAGPYRDFYERAVKNRDRCVEFIHNEVDAGKTVWVYGASTKGNVILQWYGLGADLIKGAADRSPEKWKRFTVGTDIRIESEAFAREINPDYFLVLPYAFLDEFTSREAEWRAGGGKFIVPLPEFKVV